MTRDFFVKTASVWLFSHRRWWFWAGFSSVWVCVFALGWSCHALWLGRGVSGLSPCVSRSSTSSFLDLPAGPITGSWQEQVRARLAALLHVRPSVYSGDTAIAEHLVDVSGELSGSGGIWVDWYRFLTTDGVQISGGFLQGRDSGDAPLVLVLHGHGPGLSLLFDPLSYQKAAAVRLAQAGFRVLALETRSFGDSRGSDWPPHPVYVNALRLRGEEFHGHVLADNLEILAWAKKETDWLDGAVGLVGCSMGGLAAMFLADFSDLFDAVLISGMGSSWAESFSRLPHCSCSIIPGLLTSLDSPQILAAAHCDTLALELGSTDAVLGLPSLAGIRERILGLALRGGGGVEIHTFPGGHEHDIPFVIDYFQDHLFATGVPQKGLVEP